MRILVMSDTHIPRAAADLPAKLYAEIKNVDMILHAGDFVEKELLDKLEVLRPTKGVYGNMDSAKIRSILNAKEVVEIKGLKIGLIHGYGPQADMIETVKKEFGRVNAVVFGHAHKVFNEIRNGILFFNPGSPTDTIFAPYRSYGILEITDGKIEGNIVRC